MQKFWTKHEKHLNKIYKFLWQSWSNFRIKYEDFGGKFFKNCEKNLQQLQEKLRKFFNLFGKLQEKFYSNSEKVVEKFWNQLNETIKKNIYIQWNLLITDISNPIHLPPTIPRNTPLPPSHWTHTPHPLLPSPKSWPSNLLLLPVWRSLDCCSPPCLLPVN